MVNSIINADCLSILSDWVRDQNIYKKDNNSFIDLTFTSPPYFNCKKYSFYKTYEEYLQFLKEVFSCVWHITKEGRFCVVNTSPVIEPRISRSHQSKRYPIPFDLNTIMQDIGWMFIDDIIWEKPEPSVIDRNSQFRNHRKPLTYKPNIVTEYIMVYRKKTDKLIDWNLKKYPIDIVNNSLIFDEIDRKNIWKISPKSSKLHPAIFPDELAERVVKYYSFKGDLVLDPFCGSGTTCKVSKKLGRNYIGIEKDYQYYCLTSQNINK
jgi:DNA modification methylase